MIETPIHLNVNPIMLHFKPLQESEVREKIENALPSPCEIYKHGDQDSLAGYYKFVFANDQKQFGKVFSKRRSLRNRECDFLIRELHQKKSPVNNRIGAPIELSREHTLFCYHWLEGRFFEDDQKQMAEIGLSLADLHKNLLNFPIEKETVRLGDRYYQSLAETSNLTVFASFKSKIQDLLLKKESLTEQIHSHSRMIHNDLHRGNIFFDGPKVQAFLDFEESVSSIGSPLIDLAWVIERFIICSEAPIDHFSFIETFLNHYKERAEWPLTEPIGETIEAIINLKSLHFLHLLFQADHVESSEWKKFKTVISKTESHRKILKEF